MLKSHFDLIENELVHLSKIPENSGHPLHKGTPRENFIKEFLERHLPLNLAIGTGEIIDAKSYPREKRNQYDIIIYKKSFPKLDFGSNISAFLIESVIATIEVKSNLTKAEFGKALKSAYNAKQLNTSFSNPSIKAGYIPPKILNYIVAYNGPGKIEIINNWIKEFSKKLGIDKKYNLPNVESKRHTIPSPSIDGVFILQKGFFCFDNSPITFSNPAIISRLPDLKWFYSNGVKGNLFVFFLLLFNSTCNIDTRWLNVYPYLKTFKVEGGVKFLD